MNRRTIRLIALDYAAGIIENAQGCEPPEEIDYDKDGAVFDEELRKIADGLNLRRARFRAIEAARGTPK